LIPQNRYGSANVWKIFTDLFDYFPLTALVCSLSFKPFSFLCKPLEHLQEFGKTTPYLNILAKKRKKLPPAVL
jgi:hypothetical protein